MFYYFNTTKSQRHHHKVVVGCFQKTFSVIIILNFQTLTRYIGSVDNKTITHKNNTIWYVGNDKSAVVAYCGGSERTQQLG